MKRYYTIDFDAMKYHNLSATKWMVCENIHFVQAITDSGYCEKTRAELAEHHQISKVQLKRIVGDLVVDMFLKRNTKNYLKTTQKWHKIGGIKNDTGGIKNDTQGYQKGYDGGIKNDTALPIRENLERDRESSNINPTHKIDEILEALEKKFNSSSVEMKYPLQKEAFLSWVDYRKTKRKPISDVAMKMQIKKLCAYPIDIQKQMIDQSMENDYQGLFEIKQQYKNFNAPEVGSIGWHEQQAKEKENAIDVEVG